MYHKELKNTFNIIFACFITIALSSQEFKPFSISKDICHNDELFSYFKEELNDKRIVLLGESFHRTESFNEIKFSLIKCLNSKLGFDVILFESNTSTCSISNLVKQDMDSLYLLTHSIMGGWRTNVNLELMDYVQESNIQISGFDPNLNSLIPDKKYYLSAFSEIQELANELYTNDSLFFQYVKSRGMYFKKNEFVDSIEIELEEQKEKLSSFYRVFYEKMGAHKNLGHSKKIISLIIKNRFDVLSKSNKIKEDEESRLLTFGEREKVMTRNLQFLIDSIYPDKRIIIWAHNEHISKGGVFNDLKNSENPFNNSIGFNLNKLYPSECYYIGMFGYPGVLSHHSGEKIIPKPPRNSVERKLNKIDFDSFIVSSNYLDDKPIWNYSEGMYLKKSNIRKCYDSVVFIKNLKPGVLIKKR